MQNVFPHNIHASFSDRNVFPIKMFSPTMFTFGGKNFSRSKLDQVKMCVAHYRELFLWKLCQLKHNSFTTDKKYFTFSFRDDVQLYF